MSRDVRRGNSGMCMFPWTIILQTLNKTVVTQQLLQLYGTETISNKDWPINQSHDKMQKIDGIETYLKQP